MASIGHYQRVVLLSLIETRSNKQTCVNNYTVVVGGSALWYHTVLGSSALPAWRVIIFFHVSFNISHMPHPHPLG